MYDLPVIRFSGSTVIVVTTVLASALPIRFPLASYRYSVVPLSGLVALYNRDRES